MKMDVFKTAQQVNIHLGFFCKKICHQESPNLVTLLIPHEAFAQPPPPPPKQETRKTNKNCSSIFQTSASRPKNSSKFENPFCVFQIELSEKTLTPYSYLLIKKTAHPSLFRLFSNFSNKH